MKNKLLITIIILLISVVSSCDVNAKYMVDENSAIENDDCVG